MKGCLLLPHQSHFDTIEALYVEHSDALYHYLLTLLNQRDLAEECLQTLFVNLARNPQKLETIKKQRSYLFASARNAALNHRKRLEKERGILDSLKKQTNSFHATAAKTGAAPELEHCFSLLPEEQREVLVLKIFEELSFAEIAETLGCSINTVASRYRYGCEKLKQCVGDEHGK